MNSTSGDYFGGLFEHRLSKVLIMSLSIILNIVSVTLCYSVVWYEKYGLDAKQTMLNRLFSLICWTGIEQLMFVTFPEWLRFMSGPVPKFPCWFHLIIKNGLMAKLILLYTGLIITRYSSIFWMKNPSAFNDEFWSRFIQIWVYFFSFLSQIVFLWLPGTNKINFLP